jgi:uncharacterized membrane protein
LRPGLLETAATLGAVAAGAAIFEAALVPGLLIGGAAVLAPRLIPRDMFGGGLDRSRRARRAPAFSTGAEHVPAARKAEEPQVFDTGRAVVKTFTYRMIVTAVDFGANYFVIGELATAAGLSTLSLVAGPIFYFAHEAAWHYYGPASARAADPLEAEALVPIPGAPAGEHEASASFAGVRVSRALGKTITYEGVTAVSEFVANYIFVRDIATAAGMTAFSVVISPFVYYAHEKAWDYYDATKARASAAATEGA